MLKEYVARGNYIFPPRPSMRLATDLFAYCAERLPRFNTISISGYHIREAGASAAQELAFTLANGIAYCEAAVAAGLSPDDFGERLSFFFNAHNHFFQEVAKFRAARRLWAEIMRDRFGATNPRALALRFHAQTGGSTLTAQQPENNIVRVAIQALAAICGGAQSIHTNSFDEALALPTEHAATIALRTQQILAAEAGTTDTADPLGGSYFVEALTDELEQQARALIARIDDLGGAVAAIEQGFVQAEIEASAFRHQRDVESGERVVVGVNAFAQEKGETVELLQVEPDDRAASARARDRVARGPRRGCRRRGAGRGAPRRLDGRQSPPAMREALRAEARSARFAAPCASFGVHMTPSMRSRRDLDRDRTRARPRRCDPVRGGGDVRQHAELHAQRRADHLGEVRRLSPDGRDRAVPARDGQADLVARVAHRGGRSGRRHATLASGPPLARVRRTGCADAHGAAARDDRRVGDERREGRRSRAQARRTEGSGGALGGEAREAPHAGGVPTVGAEGRHGRLSVLPPRPEAER